VFVFAEILFMQMDLRTSCSFVFVDLHIFKTKQNVCLKMKV